MGVTAMAERFITEAPILYNRQIQNFLNIKQLKIEEKNYHEYIVHFQEQLDFVHQRYCNERVGFALIDLLHRNYLIPNEADPKNAPIFAKEDSENSTYVVFTVKGSTVANTYKVHTENTVAPESLDKHPVDLDTYAQLMFKISLVKKRTTQEAEQSTVNRFRELLSKDFGAKDSKAKAKQCILESCYYLGLSSKDAEFLLLRWGDCFYSNSAEDQIWRFVLDVPSATLVDFSEILLTYQNAMASLNPTQLEAECQGVTNVAYSSLRAVILSEDTYKVKKENYAKLLISNAQVYMRYSQTAKTVFQNILLDCARKLEWKSNIFAEFPENVLTCDTTPNLSPAQQKRLVLALLSGPANTDDDIFDLDNTIAFPYHLGRIRIGYPSSVNNELMRLDIGECFEQILLGKRACTKNDLVYALFLRLIYGRARNRDTVAEYFEFKNVADSILQRLYLPLWYAAHPLEFAIGKAILAGERAEDAFQDVTNRFLTLTATGISSSTQKSKNPVLKPTGKKDLPAAYSQFEKSLQNQGVNFNADFAKEIRSLGQELYTIWEQSGYHAFSVTLHEDGRIEVDLKGASQFLLEHPLSEGLRKFLHDIDSVDDNANSLLENYTLCDDKGEGKTLYQIAAEYPLTTEYRKEVLPNLREKFLKLAKMGFKLSHTEAELTKLNPDDLKKQNISLPDSILASWEAYNQISGSTHLGDFLRFEPDWSRRIRRTVVLRALEDILLKNYGYKPGDNVAFKMPTAEVKENLKLSFDHMDPQDLEYLTDKESLPVKKANNTTAKKDARIASGSSVAPVEKKHPKSPTVTATIAKNEKKTGKKKKEEDPLKKFYCKDGKKKWIDIQKLFFFELEQHPSLSLEEELSLAQEINEYGKESAQGQAALDKLIYGNWKCVAAIAKDHHVNYSGIDYLDLVSRGFEGMLKAAEKFDPGRGYQFSTYAQYTVQEYVAKELHESFLLNISRDTFRLYLKANRVRQEFYQEHQVEASDEEVAAILGIPVEKLPKNLIPLSLNVTVDDEESTSFFDFMESPDSARQQEDAEIKATLTLAINQCTSLSRREKEVFSLHHGLFDEPEAEKVRTFSQIAELLQISVSEAILCEMVTIRKLRNEYRK